MGDFWKSFAVSAALAAALAASFPQVFHPLFAVGLVAFSAAGFFALGALLKAGFTQRGAEGAVLACSAACLLLAALYNSSLPSALTLLFLPTAFAVPAIVSLAGAAAAKISG